MADFQKVMKEWVRSRKAINENILSSFPLEMFTDDNIANIEKEVMSWAAEHPEPVYPTWAEWLNSIGVIISDRPFPALNIPVYVYQASTKMLEPIPANIAEKLGIIPKESN